MAAKAPKTLALLVDKNFFHSGDGIKTSNLTVATAAIPIAGPDMSPKDVYDFIQEIGCKTVIPVHYDYFTANPDILKTPYFGGVKAIILANGESAEI